MKELKEGQLGKILRKSKTRGSKVFEKRVEEDKDTDWVILYPDGSSRRLRKDEVPEYVELSEEEERELEEEIERELESEEYEDQS